MHAHCRLALTPLPPPPPPLRLAPVCHTVDCAPCGWDKTFCLRFLPEGEFPVIHFFGDKTQAGGGDFELYEHPRTIGYTVRDAAHTLQLVEERLLS